MVCINVHTMIEMKKNRKLPKRIVFDASIEMHTEIKSRAAKKRCTVREWISMAIIERIQREMVEEI